MIAEENPIAAAVDQQPLPSRLTALTDKVVRRTRLWPREREDVRAELESHFREGLIALSRQGMALDRCISTLEEQFGDTAITARLIRRSKKRGRPMVWKIAGRGTVVLLLGMAASVAYASWITLGRPNPTVDYLTKLNEPLLAIPAEQRAWPILEQILLEMVPPKPDNESTIKALPHPQEPGWDIALRWVENNEFLLPLIHQAADKPSYGFVYNNEKNWSFMGALAEARQEKESQFYDEYDPDPTDPELIGILLPSLSDIRTISRLLILHSRRLMPQDKFQDAWQALEDAYRLGILLHDGRTLIESLVGSAILKITSEEMRQALYRTEANLTPADLDLIRQTPLLDIPSEAIRANIDGELLVFQDIVQYLFTDDGQGNGRLIPQQYQKVTHLTESVESQEDPSTGLAMDAQLLALVAVHADRKSTLDKYLRLWEEITAYRDLPLYDPRRERGQQVITELRSDPVDSKRFALVAATLPSMHRADEIIRQTRMAHEAMKTIISILSINAEYGTHPRLPDMPDPDRAMDLPVDIYSGESLIYRPVADSGFQLYSVGTNYVDDGGAGDQDQDGKQLDIVYWPPG